VDSDGGSSRIDTGILVGELARSYFGEYSLVPYSANKDMMIADTKRLISSGANVIAEASFMAEDCFCSIDILLNKGGGHVEIIEVKSSTGTAPDEDGNPTTAIDEIYLYDVAFQYYVLHLCGYSIDAAKLMRLNKEYERHGDPDVGSLFVLDDLTEQAKLIACTMMGQSLIPQLESVAKAGEEPMGYLGSRCDADCSYYSYCWRNMPEDNVYRIGHRMLSRKKDELYYRDIVTFADALDAGVVTNEKQLRQIRSSVLNLPPHIDREGIRGFLGTLAYPLYHLDFETFQQAIPEYDGVKPYMQIPFQYSIHVQDNPCAEPRHTGFLAEAGADPRRALAEALCTDIPTGVCVLAYNRSFEMSVIKELARQFPHLSDHLMNIHDNVRDLLDPFRAGYYYCKEMGGSNSIKSVLPALFPNDPELDYEALDLIHDGGEAMDAFPAMAEMGPEELACTRAALLAYCRLDTLAMVKILERLYEAAR
jgi:hypothetical protein